MKAGTIIQLPDGRIGTLVYNGLDGRGIKWGRHTVTEQDLIDAAQGANPLFGKAPAGFDWFPDAMLRNAYAGCSLEMEYVGDEFEVVE